MSIIHKRFLECDKCLRESSQILESEDIVEFCVSINWFPMSHGEFCSEACAGLPVNAGARLHTTPHQGDMAQADTAFFKAQERAK